MVEMSVVWLSIKILIGAFGGFLGWYVGGMDNLVFGLIVFITIDYVTGIIKGYIKKQVSSRIGAVGIIKKLAILILVGMGHVIDLMLEDGSTVRTATALFFLANEGLSILENAAQLGLPIPKEIKDKLLIMHKSKVFEKSENEKENEKTQI